MMNPADTHAELVVKAIVAFKGYWEIPGTIPDPPRFVKEKFLRLEQELRSKT
jgi:hypothetical protein